MSDWRRWQTALISFGTLAAAGVVVGAALAGREVARQEFVSEGLWRSSLWLVSRGALVGGAVGTAAGLVLLALLLMWSGLIAAGGKGSGDGSRGAQRGLTVDPGRALELTVFLGLLTGLAVLAIPKEVAFRFGLYYRDVVAAAVAAFWIFGAALGAWTAFGGSGNEESGKWFGLRWVTLLGLAYIVVFLHIWARTDSWQVLTALSLGSLIIWLGASFRLRGAGRFVHDRVGRPVGRAVAGKPGRAVGGALLVAAMGLWAAGWAVKGQVRAEASSRGRNVILIGIDTLRADRTSVVSEDEYERDLTPNMRRLVAARGTVFSNAISQAPWTLPAFASIFTGVYPAEHGAELRTSVLPPGQVTVAEILREAGYRTLGVVSGAYVTGAAGMSQGFEVFDESLVGGQWPITSDGVTEKAIELLRERGREPFFLWVHYFDPHWTYRDHEEYHFADSYRGWLREVSQTLNQEDFKRYVGVTQPGVRGRRLLSPEERGFLCDLYDEDIAHTDAAIGRLLAFLDEAGLWDSTLVVVVADHGEEFLEHGKLGHQVSLYQELIHVPLAIVDPSVERGGIVARPVETRRLFKTMLDFAGIPPQRDRAYLESLSDEPSMGRDLVRSATYIVVTGVDGHLLEFPKDVWVTCVADERWKLIKYHLGDRVQLFDLQSDPGETHNAAADNPDRRRELERILERLDAEARAGAPRGPRPEAGEEQKRRLKSLGYL